MSDRTFAIILKGLCRKGFGTCLYFSMLLMVFCISAEGLYAEDFDSAVATTAQPLCQPVPVAGPQGQGCVTNLGLRHCSYCPTILSTDNHLELSIQPKGDDIVGGPHDLIVKGLPTVEDPSGKSKIYKLTVSVRVEKQ